MEPGIRGGSAIRLGLLKRLWGTYRLCVSDFDCSRWIRLTFIIDMTITIDDAVRTPHDLHYRPMVWCVHWHWTINNAYHVTRRFCYCEQQLGVKEYRPPNTMEISKTDDAAPDCITIKFVRGIRSREWIRNEFRLRVCDLNSPLNPRVRSWKLFTIVTSIRRHDVRVIYLNNAACCFNKRQVRRTGNSNGAVLLQTFTKIIIIIERQQH